MANYSVLKGAIDDVIFSNGRQEITGDILNETLKAIVSSLGGNYQYAGVVTPSTNPGTPDQNLFYIAIEAGTYVNFGGQDIPLGITIITWDGDWSYQTIYEVDTVPTNGSTKLVTSGGVYAAIMSAVSDAVSTLNANCVRANGAQNFTSAQKAQARTNIDAMAGYIDISDDDRYQDGFTATEFRERKFLYDGRECLVAIVPGDDEENEYIAYFAENNTTNIPTGVLSYLNTVYQSNTLWASVSDSIKCKFYHMTLDQWDNLNDTMTEAQLQELFPLSTDNLAEQGDAGTDEQANDELI